MCLHTAAYDSVDVDGWLAEDSSELLIRPVKLRTQYEVCSFEDNGWHIL
jgi:hypothetical protein